ncbi:MAG: cysteine hydrolase [Hyphomonadaceae bacterium]|nr:cysteine hydrolase [Hyphomonadaceae bacterium]
MVDFAISPARTALINVDLQNCFVADSPLAAPDGPAIVQRVNRLAAACREAGALVVHTLITYRPDRSNIGVAKNFMPPAALEARLLEQGQKSAELHRDLVVAPDDILLEKPRYGAFHATDLDLILRNRGIEAVIITGICTNICCETTAREAAVRDYKVLFTSDGTTTFATGGLTHQELQRATCATLAVVFAQVLSVDEAIAKIRGARAAA